MILPRFGAVTFPDRAGSVPGLLRGRERVRVMERRGQMGTPRIGAQKEGEKAADAGRDMICGTAIVIIMDFPSCQEFFYFFFTGS